MPSYRVKQGDCLVTIAQQYGFSSYEAIYNHPENAELKKKRPNPSIIHTGDVVFIPEHEPKQVDIATGKLHSFRLKRLVRMLRLKMQDVDGKALAGKAYTLDFGGALVEGTTDGDGKLEEPVPDKVTAGTLVLGEREWSLDLGHLNPLEEAKEGDVSGVQERLKNLGFNVGESDGSLGPRTRSALRAFQHLQGLEPTGHVDDKTLAKLKDAHGS